jgi:hypothetical protein
VLSGVAKEDDIPGSGQTPDYIAPDIHELLKMI